MHAPLFIVRFGLSGIRGPEFVLIVVILWVLFLRIYAPRMSAHSGSSPVLSRYEKRVLATIAAVVAVGIGVIVWQNIGR
jgi:hypothetical protein